MLDDISRILTSEEKLFIREHNLSFSDFYDAREEVKKTYHDNAKTRNCRFVVTKPCKNGHRLKTRSGHCIMCNPAHIAFQKREGDGGVVYLAVNNKYCKVGMIDAVSSVKEALTHREYQLNSEGGYGEMVGWKIIKSWIVNSNAGKIERTAHELLSQYKIEKYYLYSGDIRIANELFKCSENEAQCAILLALEECCHWTI